MEIYELSQKPEMIEAGIEFFWSCWGSKKNLPFYRDCMLNSLSEQKPLPKFYIELENNEIIGTYALLVNDLISRQDIMPWFACLFVKKNFRGKGIAANLLNHGLRQAALKGFDTLYLSTDLEDFYEKKGWTFFDYGYGVSGIKLKIYSHQTRLFNKATH
jgi:GNAT superfamily N-acetyltransferase